MSVLLLPRLLDPRLSSPPIPMAEFSTPMPARLQRYRVLGGLEARMVAPWLVDTHGGRVTVGAVPQVPMRPETLEQKRRRLFAPEGIEARSQWLQALEEDIGRGHIQRADAECEQLLGLPRFLTGHDRFEGLGAYPRLRADASSAEPSSLWDWLPTVKAMEIQEGEVVCDVGAGVGKPTLLFAALTPVSLAIGIEVVPDFVRIATTLAAQLNLSSRTQFLNGDVETMELPEADAFYLYNPFNADKGRDISKTVAERLIALGEERNIKIAVTGIIGSYLRRASTVFVERPVLESASWWRVFASRGSPLGERIAAEQRGARVGPQVFAMPRREAPRNDVGSRNAAAAERCRRLGLDVEEIAAEYAAHDWQARIRQETGYEPTSPLSFAQFVDACAYTALSARISEWEATACREFSSMANGSSPHGFMALRASYLAQLEARETLRESAGLSAIVPPADLDDVLSAVFGKTLSAPAAEARSAARPAIRFPDVVREGLKVVLACVVPDDPQEPITVRHERMALRKRLRQELRAGTGIASLLQGAAREEWWTAVFGGTRTARSMAETVGHAALPHKKMPALYPAPPDAQAYLYGLEGIFRTASEDSGAKDEAASRFSPIAGYAGRWQVAGTDADRPRWVGGYADALGPSFTQWVGRLQAGHRVLIDAPGAQELIDSWQAPTPLDRELPQPQAMPEVVIDRPGFADWQQVEPGSFEGVILWQRPDGALHETLIDAGTLLKAGGVLFFGQPASARFCTEDGEVLSLQEVFENYVGGFEWLPTRVHPEALIFDEWQYGYRIARMAQRTGDPVRIPQFRRVTDPRTGEEMFAVSSAPAMSLRGRVAL